MKAREHRQTTSDMEKDVSLAHIRKESRLKDNCISLGIEYKRKHLPDADAVTHQRQQANLSPVEREVLTLQRSTITTTTSSKSIH